MDVLKMQTESIPLFIQVAETIKARILNYEYSPGDSIPSAKELEKEFGVSNITIRRAIELLAKIGCIIPKRGMRARVAAQTKDIVEIELTGDFRSWVDMAVGRKIGITAKILDRQIIECPKPIRELLSMDSGEKVERIRRVRKLKENPISYYVNYSPRYYLKKLTNRQIETHTFIEAFQKAYNIKLKSMEQKVRATIADMDLADILQVGFGFPLFFVQNVYYSAKEVPLAVTHMYYRSDHYVYTIKRDY